MPDVGAQQRNSQKFLVFDKWDKMNTRLAREALPETQAAWMENIQPVGPNNLVPVPARLSALTSLPPTETIVAMFGANIGDTDYMICFTAAGGGYAINLGTLPLQAPNFVSNGAFTIRTGTTLTVALPTPLITGALLIAIARVHGTTGATLNVSSGWTPIYNTGAGTRAVMAAYAYVTGTEAPPVFTASTPDALQGWVTQYNGVASSSPIGNWSVNGHTTGTSLVATNIVTTGAASTVACFMVSDGGGTLSTPNKFTSRATEATQGAARWSDQSITLETSGTGTVIATSTIAGAWAASLIELLSSGQTATATWDPSDVSGMTLSNSNLTATNSAAPAIVRAQNAFSSGKFYFELTCTTFTAAFAGLAQISTPPGTTTMAVASNQAGLIFVNGTSTGIGIGPPVGRALGVAVDLDNKLIWFRAGPTGSWNAPSGSANDPTTGVGWIDMSAVAANLFPYFAATATGQSVLANFGATPFAGTVPSGYTAGWPLALVQQFAPDGTFSTSPDCTVYAGQRILIADAISGYCTWDGSVFVDAAGLSPNISVTNGGTTAYTSPPTVAISGGHGTGATAHAVLAGGFVVSVVLDNPGTGYVPGDAPTLAFSGGGGTGAAATVRIWPTIACTTVATFEGRTWLGNQHVLTWTGTAGFDDANPANAAGSTTITDADLSHSIQALRNLNNYLYIFGDTSVRQIGSIAISGNITLFTPLSLASDIGTTFKYTVQSYNRLVVFCNKNGVYAIFGASVEKISDDLDGIFGGLGPSHSNIDFTLTPSAALNDVRNIHCYLVLVRYLDPLSSARSIILVFQERTWFIASQGDGLNVIAAVPLKATAQFETYGSSGADISQLLQDTATAVSITLRTSLSPHGNAVQAKQPLRAGIGIRASTPWPITLQLDTENTAYVTQLFAGGIITWINDIGGVVIWLNNSNGRVNWGARGFAMPYSTVEGAGKYLGATVTATLAESVLSIIAIEYQDRALWGSAQ